MNLIEWLKKHRSPVVKAWIDQVIATYPPDTALFLRSQSDRFANPVGQNIIASLEGLFDALLEEFDPQKLTPILDPIIRIRAVQSFTPSQAVGFTLDLKRILWDRLNSHRRDTLSLKEWRALEARIDAVALLAYDIYVTCREQIANLRVSTERDKTYRAFARAGLIVETPEEAPDLNVSPS
jgi:hypothetical protein